MNFEFSDDQKQLRDSARKFLEAKCTPAAVRAVLEGPQPFDKELWNGLAEMGFLGIVIPEEHGGLGAGYLELCVVAEELGRVVAPVPFNSSVFLATEFLLAAGSDAQKAAWLPKLAAGEAIGTFAFAEGVGPTTPKAIKVAASGGTITGVKLPVADGDIADFAIVAARTAPGNDEQSTGPAERTDSRGAGPSTRINRLFEEELRTFTWQARSCLSRIRSENCELYA